MNLKLKTVTFFEVTRGYTGYKKSLLIWGFRVPPSVISHRHLKALTSRIRARSPGAAASDVRNTSVFWTRFLRLWKPCFYGISIFRFWWGFLNTQGLGSSCSLSPSSSVTSSPLKLERKGGAQRNRVAVERELLAARACGETVSVGEDVRVATRELLPRSRG